MTTAQEIMKLFTDKKTLQIFNTIAKLNVMIVLFC